MVSDSNKFVLIIVRNFQTVVDSEGRGKVGKQLVSDVVSRLGLGLETCLETRFSESRSRRSQVSSWSRRISVSVSSSSSRDFA